MPDLHTNLILNDKQFNDGLRRAEGGLSAFTSKVKGFSGGLKTVLGVAGLASTIGAVIESYTKIRDAQTRINAGVASFEDRWTAAQGSLANFLTGMPFLGDSFDKLNRTLGGFEEGRIRDEALARGKSTLASLYEQLEVAGAQTEERREQIRLQQEDRRTVEEIIKIEKATGEFQGKLRSVSYELFNLRMKDLKARQQAAALEKQTAEDIKIQVQEKAKLNSNISFQESMFSEQTSMLRELGQTDEADRREIEQRRRQMIRNIWNDPTITPYSDEARARSDEANRIADLRLQLLGMKRKEESGYSVSTSAGGSASLIGQVFAPGAMNEQKRQQQKLNDTANSILIELRKLISRTPGHAMYN